MSNSPFITDAELTGYVNGSLFELFDILVQAYGEDYFILQADVTTTGEHDHIALPEDLYKLCGVDKMIATDEWVTVHPFTMAERNNRWRRGGIVRYRLQGSNLWFTPKPNAGETFRIFYIPKLTPLVNDEDQADSVSGWLEYVLVDAAIKCLQKEESDPSAFMAQKVALKERIESAARSRNASGEVRAAPTAFDSYFGFGGYGYDFNR